MHPVLVEFGGMTLYTYGLFVALSLAAAFIWTRFVPPPQGVKRSELLDIVFVSFAGGIVGARVFYVLQHVDRYAQNWLGAFSLREGGLVWYGGFILAVASAVVYALVKRLSVIKLADYFSPVICLAHGIGRVGCFFNGCCYGHSSFPVQLYEATALFVIGAWLTHLSQPRVAEPRYSGQVFGWYLVSYGTLRFMLEFKRGDQAPFAAGLTIAQWMSLGLVLAGIWIFVVRRKEQAQAWRK